MVAVLVLFVSVPRRRRRRDAPLCLARPPCARCRRRTPPLREPEQVRGPRAGKQRRRPCRRRKRWLVVNAAPDAFPALDPSLSDYPP